MPAFEKTPLNKVRRVAERGEYDRKSVYEIVDDALICHVGFVVDGQPFVIPTIHARDEDAILLHGAKASRMLKHLTAGGSVCITCTHLDALVLARSVFHHSMNYRSAVIFGRGRIVDDPEEKMAGLQTLTEHLMPGRWDEARHPSAKEMNATTLIRVEIESASAKRREGPVGDEEEDYVLPVWAGLLPVERVFSAAENDDRLVEGVTVPTYVTDYHRARDQGA
jgi:uncharacterized protein